MVSFDVKALQIFFGCRRHYLECMQGWLGKHFEKLGYPYFESRISSFEDTNVRDHEFDLNNEGSPNFIDLTSPFGAQCSSKSKQDPRPLTCIHQEKQSPRSVNYVFYLISALKLS